MSSLLPTAIISWSGISDTPRSRIRQVTWEALGTPHGISVTVVVSYRGDAPGTSQDIVARYRPENAPAWVPFPPDGWLDSLGALEGAWRYAKDADLETVVPE